jgi:integrase/recombinase XerD
MSSGTTKSTTTVQHARKRSAVRAQAEHYPDAEESKRRAQSRTSRKPSQVQSRSLEPQELSRLVGPALQERADQEASMSISCAIEDYLADHRGGNHSAKTLEWHQTALGLLQSYLEQERGITQVREIDAAAISGWFTHLRKIPGARGKARSERTVQTYARSARAFVHWLLRRHLITENPFAEVIFPRVGKPLIQTLTEDEFERLLVACTPPHREGRLAERATARNRAILWLLYDTGIRVSELCGLRLGDLDRKQGVITVQGKGSKQRRIALGQNCLRALLHYLDRHRPDAEELAAWGQAGEDHLLLSESRQPLTKNGLTLLFARLKQRAGITGKRVSPHILRHTFAVRYLVLGNDPFSLQELLGHEDLTTVRYYMHMNDATIQAQKRKYSPGDHLSTSISDPQPTRRRGFVGKEEHKHP